MIETELDIAKFYHKYSKHSFKYSKKYIYRYDNDTALWVECCEDTIISYMTQYLVDIIAHYIKENQKDTGVLNTMKKLLTKIKYKTIRDIVKYYKEYITDNEFMNNLNRCHSHLLPIKNNKVVDLTTGEIIQRTKEHLFSYSCDVDKTDKKSKFFEDFLNQIVCYDSEALSYLQKILGYCLTGDISGRCYFIFYGKGKNGKSVLLLLMNHIMKIAYKSAMKSLFINTGSKTTNGCELVDIKDARIATFSETSCSEQLNESVLKMISGSDVMTGHAKYKDPISFIPMCKLILCTNHQPSFDGNDMANIDRIKMFSFKARFTTEENELKNEYKVIPDIHKILIEEHIDEFFTWILKGAIEFYKDKEFKPPANIKLIEDSYKKEQASVSYWFNENVIVANDSYIKRSEIYIHYTTFCNDIGITPLKKKRYLNIIDDLIENKTFIKSNGDYICKGYKLQDDKTTNTTTNTTNDIYEDNDDIDKEELNKREKFLNNINKVNKHGLDT
jgi:P4 family phage/plasmid primase-like protien